MNKRIQKKKNAQAISEMLNQSPSSDGILKLGNNLWRIHSPTISITPPMNYYPEIEIEGFLIERERLLK